MNKQIILFLSLVVLVACGGVDSGGVDSGSTLSDANDRADRITPPTTPTPTPPTTPTPTPTPPSNSFTYNVCAVPGLGASVSLGDLEPSELRGGYEFTANLLLGPVDATFYSISIIDRRALAYELLAPQGVKFLLMKADLCTTTDFESPMPIGPYYLVVVNLNNFDAFAKIKIELGTVEPTVANVYNDLLELTGQPPIELIASEMLFDNK